MAACPGCGISYCLSCEKSVDPGLYRCEPECRQEHDDMDPFAQSARAYAKRCDELKKERDELISIIGDAERAAALGRTRLKTCEIEAPDVDSRYHGLMTSIKEAGLTWNKAGILEGKKVDDELL